MEDYRTVGEFEKQESILLIWPPSPYATSHLSNDIVSTKVVQAIIGEVDIIVCCFDKTVEQRAQKALTHCGVDIALIRFVVFPSEIIYPRDFGAEVMIGNLGNRARVDFRFNAYGFASEGDDISLLLRGFGKFHAELAGITDSIPSTLISEGGDREFNGCGVMMAIHETEVAKRNPEKSTMEVENELKRIFHLNQIIWIPQCSYDDELPFSGAIPSSDGRWNSYRSSSANGHIDEICRFASKDTIIIAHISEAEAQASKLHALNKVRLDMAYEAVKNAKKFDGTPFTILKMPVPEPIYVDLYPEDNGFSLWSKASDMMGGVLLDGTPFPAAPINVLPALSYCNFLIANGVVVAQKYYEEGMPEIIREKDETALQVLQTAFPDHRIVQINTLSLNLYGGGIHCHTRNIPAAVRQFSIS
ncbi:MAG TPA: agmatine deiminase family protein [Negativicutes bacterium]|nr:agmatine deiminase family protein [Negativicutes bacterium]